jgi:uncharacterized lipoprotein YbaY
MPGNDPLVSGEIIFTSDAHGFRDATVYVRLEEVSRTDAAARIVAEQVLRGVAYEQGRPLPFEIRGGAPGGASYRVRVHVDIDGDGQVSSGDYISVESYPVTLSGAPALQVRVYRV